MTRPRLSKRELKRKLQEIDDGGLSAPDAQTPEIQKRRSEAVVSLVYGVSRDLMRLTYNHPDETINEPDDVVATERFLKLVRDEYEVEADADRDQRLVETLVLSAKGNRQVSPINVFEMAPVSIATHVDVRTADGAGLAELVEAGRETEAERALVRETYKLVAGDAGAPMEVKA